MSKLFKTTALATAVLCVCLGLVGSPRADDSRGDDELVTRVAALEEMVNQLQRQIQNDKLASSLRGHWVEQSHTVAGVQEAYTEAIEWRLATDASSDRYILAPEVSTFSFGRFSVDTSKKPTEINFQKRWKGQSYAVKGIVRTSYGKSEISIPSTLFDGDKFLDPPRPDSFESTPSNKYDVYRLIRKRYKETGVWQ